MAKRRRSRPAGPPKRAPEPASKVDFATEYHYVVSDLKRFGLLALAMLGLLIALALALPAL
jgi:hypothetical protein